MSNNKFLYLGAVTNSEWDSCNLALVPITEEYINTLKRLIALRDQLEKEHGIDVISYYGEEAEFYNTDEDIDGDTQEVREDEVKGLSTPEARLDVHQVKIRKFDICFSCYGKHNLNEEYWATVTHDFINTIKF